MSALKILVIPGSTRAGSHNARLAAAAAYQFVLAGVDVTRISLADFPLPIYDADLEAASGVPREALHLKRMIGAHDGVLLVTPEYNGAVPPLLSNAIAWLSRVDEPPDGRGALFRTRPFAIAAASENRFGGVRALAALRQMLTACNATVIPSQLALAFADKAYNDLDRLRLPADIAALDALVRQLIETAQTTM
ncbi:oxidoreductase [Bradyrhizobium sp. SSBR45G]|uniref:NADPH-dependent FMN reductase n=1 Tax=unclassified Bradyrhizobium TaxID=2631580 RepID=UPI002342A1A9|nr:MULTISPECIES: NAD(P)H-dependent oxidoreductase [unclassified Bradyrhizobium]GLH77639.1 oxidoreductase [Bradyrhizobium sp. SSBR45G]GLH84876.1 oxidoreductase [Bradyrhizobium sp. SSBR45R]